MTSRERMYRTLEFNHPDRVPRDLWMIPIATIEHGAETLKAFRQRWPGDIIQCSAGKPRALRGYGDMTELGDSMDEWGCKFHNIYRGIMGEVKEPLVDDWSKLDLVQPPRELLQVDIAAANAFCRSSDQFILASGWGRTWERIQFLRGTENVMMDLAEESPEFFELLNRVHTFYRDQFAAWAQTECDALVHMDDWGSQRALLISPDQWRRIFKPLYAEYVQIAHARKKKFFLHSDGQIQAIYPDLIEIGVDAVNSQLFCMDIEELGRTARGKITFWGEIDRQHILPWGTPEEARAAVRRVAENLRPKDTGGGVIAQFELTSKAKLANAEAIYEEWERVR